MKIEKQKKYKFLVLLLLIFGIILIGIGTYIKYQNNNNKISEYEELDVNSQIIKDLFFLTRGYNTNSLFQETSYYNIYYNNEEYSISDMDFTFKMMLSYYTLNRNYIAYENEQLFFKSSDLKEQYMKIFEDENYQDGDIYCNCPYNIIYDAINEQYIIESASSYERLEGYENKIIEARKYDDRIEIYEKVMFYITDSDEGINTYYKDSIFKEKIGSELINEKIDVDKYQKFLNTYKYTFEMNGENYNFTKVERIEIK